MSAASDRQGGDLRKTRRTTATLCESSALGADKRLQSAYGTPGDQDSREFTEHCNAASKGFARGSTVY